MTGIVKRVLLRSQTWWRRGEETLTTRASCNSSFLSSATKLVAAACTVVLSRCCTEVAHIITLCMYITLGYQV